MKRKLLLGCIAIVAMLVSCQKENEQNNGNNSGISNIHYVLNNGNWNANDSNIGIYNIDNKEFTPQVFYNANSLNLGDLGQDIIISGDEIYIAVNGSKVIFVTDKTLKIKKKIEINLEGNTQARLSPRRFAKGNGKVYVTLYEGYLGEINPKDYSVRITAVGASPEGVAFANNKLYVANSGGANYPNYDKTVSVVDAEAFVELEKINVNTNPEFVEANADGSLVFVSSKGNYGDIPANLQVINPSNNKVSDLGINNLIWMSMGPANKLYLLTGGFDGNMPLPGNILYIDASKENGKPIEFIKDETVLKNAYSVSATSDGYIFAGCSDFKTNGDVYVFNPEGKLIHKFDSQGINPHKVI